MTRIRGLIFDKDGTLFDFRATWDAWAGEVLNELAAAGSVEVALLAEVIGYDLAAGGMRADSVFIAGTNAEVTACLLPLLPGWDGPRLERFLNDRAARVSPVCPVALRPYLGTLRARGFGIAVATNDAEASAAEHLAAADVADLVDATLGYDSGHTPKPAPDMCLAAAALLGLPPEACAMIGDSTHDLQAGREAGMATVGVLTGLAGPATLSPLADVVGPHIGHVPGWLAARDGAP